MEDEQEEEEGAEDFRDHNVHPDDDSMSFDDGQAEKHNSDACFDGHVGNHVDWLATPPPLIGVSCGLET